MNVVTAILVLPALALMAAVCVPAPIANSKVRSFRRIVTVAAGLQFVLAAAMSIAYAVGAVPPIRSVLIDFSGDAAIAATVYYDGVSSLMLGLVSFVGFVICGYSIRYLDGESNQGNYFRWTAFTIGSVSLTAISGNLMIFIGGWVMTSLGLHRLLLYYGHRPAAQRAAWTKFTISRIGDAALIGAMSIIFYEFKTLDFVDLFAALQGLGGDPAANVHIAGFLLVAGAVTKSAQFPFHTWLPQTMETPTPVSALMHAGIVNAGGYLIVRTSPFLSATPAALALLAILGAVTACFAAVVMLTQTSVKKSLAYSTVAQMGFMMLQCGMGAFTAAMLHILAHSLYKAHAFLSSGGVMARRAATEGTTAAGKRVAPIQLVGLGITCVLLVAGAMAIFGLNPATKPGGLLLGGVLCLALTQWLAQTLRTGDRPLLIRATLVSAILCLAYVASLIGVGNLIGTSVPAASSPNLLWLVSAIVLAGFSGMFILHTRLSVSARPNWLNRFYIHAANGFYVENAFRRVFGSLASS